MFFFCFFFFGGGGGGSGVLGDFRGLAGFVGGLVV